MTGDGVDDCSPRLESERLHRTATDDTKLLVDGQVAVDDRIGGNEVAVPATLNVAFRFVARQSPQSSPSDALSLPMHPRDELCDLKYIDDNSGMILALSASTRRRRRPKFATPYLRRDCAKVLNEWFTANLHRPYPSAEDKLELQKKSVRTTHSCACKVQFSKYQHAGSHTPPNTQLVSQR